MQASSWSLPPGHLTRDLKSSALLRKPLACLVDKMLTVDASFSSGDTLLIFMARDHNAALTVWERTLLFYVSLRGDEADDGRYSGKGSTENVFHTECFRLHSSIYV